MPRRVLALVCAATLWSAEAWAQQEPRLEPRGGAPLAPCTMLSQNLRTDEVFRDLYFWYRQMPDVRPWRYASPEAYLEAVRYRPLDSRFSSVASKTAFNALFSDSQFVGFGFSTRTTDTSITILQVFPESPASEAGLGRGDRIVAVGGRSVASLLAASGDIFGPATEGVTLTADVITRGAQARQVTLRKRVVTIPPVSMTRAFEVDGRVVGYILFRQFVRPSSAELDAAFAALRAAGATELVLDLRYNGGGLIDVAVHLASLVGGVETQGQVFARLRHNDRNARFDQTLRFESAPAPLRLTKLVVITTGASASASEVVINGLEPFMPVVVIGARTFGKPVGQYGIEMCDRVLLPVAFQTVNANGFGDYFDGLPVDCAAPDDAAQDLGSAGEASLAEALRYIRTGACSPPAPPGSAEPGRIELAGPPADDWQLLLNAQ